MLPGPLALVVIVNVHIHPYPPDMAMTNSSCEVCFSTCNLRLLWLAPPRAEEEDPSAGNA